MPSSASGIPMNAKIRKGAGWTQRSATTSTRRPRSTKTPAMRKHRSIGVCEVISVPSSVPEFHLIEAGNVMHGVVTAAGKARHLIGDEIIVQRGVRRRFFKRARAEMAVQALPVVVGHVEMKRLRRFAKI